MSNKYGCYSYCRPMPITQNKFVDYKILPFGTHQFTSLRTPDLSWCKSHGVADNYPFDKIRTRRLKQAPGLDFSHLELISGGKQLVRCKLFRSCGRQAYTGEVFAAFSTGLAIVLFEPLDYHFATGYMFPKPTPPSSATARSRTVPSGNRSTHVFAAAGSTPAHLCSTEIAAST